VHSTICWQIGDVKLIIPFLNVINLHNIIIILFLFVHSLLSSLKNIYYISLILILIIIDIICWLICLTLLALRWSFIMIISLFLFLSFIRWWFIWSFVLVLLISLSFRKKLNSFRLFRMAGYTSKFFEEHCLLLLNWAEISIAASVSCFFFFGLKLLLINTISLFSFLAGCIQIFKIVDIWGEMLLRE